MNCDYLIIGGGSAGCVLAHRLSADPSLRVVLVEAGRDITRETMPAEIRDSYPGTAYINPAYQWRGLEVASIAKGGHNAEGPKVRRPYAQARILGGGSTINGQMANWGVPSDYTDWENLGAAGWGWDGVFPYFKKVETDLDLPGPNHGTSGPIKVRRLPKSQWSRHQAAIGEALTEIGYPYLQDQNGDWGDGWFALTHSNAAEARSSAVLEYLDPATRARPNLRIITEAQVSQLHFEGKRCIGASYVQGNTAIRLTARETILSAGAIHSPAMLLRAGIGPASELREKGITPLVNLAGVGRGLMDHPQIALGSYMKPEARMDGSTGRHVHVGLRYTSAIPDAPPGDMFLGAGSRTAWHKVGNQLGALTVWVNKTFSRDGSVQLASQDWRVEPEVDFKLLSDRRDMTRLKEGFHLMARIQMTKALREITDTPFPASYTDRARQVGVVNAKNRFLTASMAALLEGPAPLRRALMKGFILSRHDFETCLRDEEALEDFITESVAGIWHASCSCRMGAADNPLAVTDETGRVYGVAGLRVCDASIFPSVPSANTNFPVMMCAEKISDGIMAVEAGQRSAVA